MTENPFGAEMVAIYGDRGVILCVRSRNWCEDCRGHWQEGDEDWPPPYWVSWGIVGKLEPMVATRPRWTCRRIRIWMESCFPQETFDDEGAAKALFREKAEWVRQAGQEG